MNCISSNALRCVNFPSLLTAHKIAPAIAAGCTMVLKPPPQTPLTPLIVAEIVHEAGWQANSKVVKAADEMYQGMNNLTR